MLSSFHGIELGKQGLMGNRIAINTIGENLQNLNNPAYSRRIAKLSSTPAIEAPGVNSTTNAGQIGTGTKVESILRVRDYFLESRLTSEKSMHGYWNKTFDALQQIESIYSTNSTETLKQNLQRFIQAWNQVGQSPQELGKREILKTNAIQLSQSIRKNFQDLQQLKSNIKSELEELVADINQIAKKLTDLNQQIVKIKAEHKNPNTLLDERDQLIQNLSSKVPIQVVHSDIDDEVMVFIESSILVQGSQLEKLKLIHDKENPQQQRIIWENTKTEIWIGNKGELSGLLKIHNTVIPHQQSLLNQFSMNLIHGVNDLHQQGFGLNGTTNIHFFNEASISPEAFGQFKPNDQAENHLGLYELKGSQTLNLSDKLVTGGQLQFNDNTSNRIRIEYQPGDSIAELIQRINQSSANVVASLDANNQFVLKAAEPLSINGSDSFIIQHVEDSGIFLSGYAGILKSNEVLNWSALNSTNQLDQNASYSVAAKINPASWIQVNEAIIKDTRNIAAASSKDSITMTGVGNGHNAMKIMMLIQGTKTDVNLLPNKFSVDKQGRHFEKFLDDQIQTLAADTQLAQLELKKESSILQHLVQRQQSISGVNIDEEMTSLVVYQYGYNASARFVTYIDRMLNTLIREMGV